MNAKKQQIMIKDSRLMTYVNLDFASYKKSNTSKWSLQVSRIILNPKLLNHYESMNVKNEYMNHWTSKIKEFITNQNQV
jgi:hypothetical protein